MLHRDRVLILVAVAIALFMIAPPTSPIVMPGMSPIAMSGERPAEVTADDESDEGHAVGTANAAPIQATLPDPTPDPGPTPEPKPRPEVPKVRGILMSGYTAGGSRFESLVDLIERTELNAVVIDIKDESGEISWMPSSPVLQSIGAGRPKMRNPQARIDYLKSKGIFVIGRIVTFQDPVLAAQRPDLAVQDRQGGVWENRKGLSWADPYSESVWEYNLELAREAASLGFDEIQFDYIRFPTDGAGERLWYRHRDMRVRTEVINGFLERARSELVGLGVWISADVFGLVTLVSTDMGIGQILEEMAPHLDYLSPMVYPSHYAKPEHGIPDPEREPYRTIHMSMQRALERTEGTGVKYRPWLQDFSLGVRYTAAEVRAQIRATEELGIEEWLLWNAANRYTEEALRPAR